MKKHLIWVVAPPASGKTTITEVVAKLLKGCVYLDKDDVLDLSAKVFEVAGVENDRSSDFFKKWVRNAEYDAIMTVAYDALRFNDYVIVNAPFTSEVRKPEVLAGFREKLAKYDASLDIIWVNCTPDTVHRRMIARASERDWWKLEHWDEYVAGINYTQPDTVPDEMVVDNNSDGVGFVPSLLKVIKRIKPEFDAEAYDWLVDLIEKK